ncbi:hypothetical protein V8E53_006116 [Lactarius tabidus]
MFWIMAEPRWRLLKPACVEVCDGDGGSKTIGPVTLTRNTGDCRPRVLKSSIVHLMASESCQANESGSTPQHPSENTPNVLQQGVSAIQIPSPALITPHAHTCTPLTRAFAAGPKPSWLRPGRSKPNGLVPSSSVGPNLGINLRPRTRTDPSRSCAPETAQTAPHDPSSSVSASAPMASCIPSAERTGKRKAEDEAPSGDKEPRLASSAAKGRGGTIFINADESSKIMKISEENRAAALVKNRRVTVAGGEEARDTDHPKRAKRAAAAAPPLDDNDTDTQLTWKRKIPVASSSVSGIKGKGVGATSAACGMPRATAAAGNTNGPGLGAISQELPSGVCDGTNRFSVPRGAALLGETALPSQEIARVDAEPTMMLRAWHDETTDETRPTTNAQPMDWTSASSLIEETARSARPGQPDMSAPLPAQPFSGEFANTRWFVPPPPWRNETKRALPTEEPLRDECGRFIGKGKGKGKACASLLRNGSFCVGNPETSLNADISTLVPQPAPGATTSRHSSRKRKSAETFARISHVAKNAGNTSTTPRKRLRAQSHNTSGEDTSDPDVVPQAHPLRNKPARKKSSWRVVEPPKSRVILTQRLAAPSSRPRVWAGSKDELLAAFPALARNESGVVWESLQYPTLIFSGDGSGSRLGWWEEDAWENRRIVFSIIRETDAPLTSPPKQPFVFSASDPTPDGGLTVVDAQPPPENPSNPPFDGNGARMVPCSALYSGSSAPSSGQMDAGPPLISVECPTGAPPSQPTCPIEISSREFDPSPSTLEPELRPDHDVCTNAGGHLAAPSISCGADATPDGRPPSNSPSAEATRIDGPPSFDAPISVVHSHANDSAGGVSTFDTKCMSSETRGDELSRSAPPFTREHPVEHSPQAGPAFPSPSKSVHPNANFPSRTAVTASAVSVSCASENLPLPRPPPEVAALLSAQSSGRAVSPIVARDSPLVRWELPSAIGYFWLGFFWISAVKVETRLRQKSSTSKASKALTVQRTWRFFLEWVPGGEDQLKDEWTHFMPPWWEPEHPQQQPNQQPLFKPSESFSGSSPIPEWPDITITGPKPRYTPLLLPLALLAPFSEASTASGTFPPGHYCTSCGRINVQRFLRHRFCEGATCNSRIDAPTEIGWAVSASSTRDRKVASATIIPDDLWAEPTTEGLVTDFDDGARLFQYHLAAGDAPLILNPSGAGVDTHAHSVRHVFNGNIVALQGVASVLFETLQRHVRIERSIGSSVFTTPLIESRNDPALGHHEHNVWGQQADFIEGALHTYCCDLGPLKVRSLRVHAWSSGGKHVQTFCPRTKHLVLLCLGADIAMLSVLSDPNAKTSGKSKKECLRVTMVHGDIVVLSGGQFKASNIRIDRRTLISFGSPQWSVQACVCY